MEDNLKVSYEQIKKANDTIRTTDIKGKEYAEVNQRIKAFRMVYPNGMIETKLVSNENGICIFKAFVGYRDSEGEIQILSTGTAYEKENSTFINKTSYIENCETSAVGRALGMAGFGIDTSVASAEEVQNAINNQETIETIEEAENYVITFGKYKDKTLKEIAEENESYMNWLLENGNEVVKSAVRLLGYTEKTEEDVKNMPIQEGQKQRLKDEVDRETLKLFLQSVGKIKVSELTFDEAKQLLGD